MATIAKLEAQLQRYATLMDNIALGICCFDAEQRLTLCNLRFAQIYRLTPDQVRPGTSLQAIVSARAAAGTEPAEINEYVSWCAAINVGSEPIHWTAELIDGRNIHISHQPMPDGGWVATHEDMSTIKASRDLPSQHLPLQSMIDLVPDFLWIKDTESRFVVANRAIAEAHGLERTSDMVGLSDFDLHPLENAHQFHEHERDILRRGESMRNLEERTVDAAGKARWFSTTKVPFRDEDNRVCGLVGISHDITSRKLADDLRDSQAQILEMIAMRAPLDRVLDRVLRLLETQIDGVTGSLLLLNDDGSRLKHEAAPSLPADFVAAMEQDREGMRFGWSAGVVSREMQITVADIATDPLWDCHRHHALHHGFTAAWSTAIASGAGDVVGVIALYLPALRHPTPAEGNLIDIATRIAGIAIERQRAEERLQFMANHDVLTGLPNRALLKTMLKQAIQQAQRHKCWIAVLFLDLDNLKLVNDCFGHNAGDELLRQMAERIVHTIGPAGTVARLGGDEFAICVTGEDPSFDSLSTTIQDMRSALASPVSLLGHDLRVTISFGAALYPNDGADVDSLLACAHAALHKAKQIGPNNIQFYEPDLNTTAREKLLLREDLHHAVTRGELVLHYQPQVDLRSGIVIAVEALLRWNHPSLGLVPPAKFIPLAEETGLIIDIGEWVLREACRQNKAWQDAGLTPITVCVNVSRRQFTDKTLMTKVVRALRDTGLASHYLELELTESLIMQNMHQAVATMQDLQDLGIHLSIDDFGTGYSSLSALKSFPLTRLKIDKSFIDEIVSSASDRAVTAAVISLGQKLNLRVIAEGVETDAQVSFLRENNCDEMQGYNFSRPLVASGIAAMLGARQLAKLGDTLG